MFDVGFWELATIALVALVVVGPQKLPGMARTAGKWMGQARRLARELRVELEREADIRPEIQDLRRYTMANNRDDVIKDVDRTLAGSIDLDPAAKRAEDVKKT